MILMDGHTVLGTVLHEILHWLLALVFVSVPLFLNWAIKRRTTWGYLSITSTNILWWLGFVVSLSVVSHCLGDGIIKLPFWEISI
jgi:hypothetical protein